MTPRFSFWLLEDLYPYTEDWMQGREAIYRTGVLFWLWLLIGTSPPESDWSEVRRLLSEAMNQRPRTVSDAAWDAVIAAWWCTQDGPEAVQNAVDVAAWAAWADAHDRTDPAVSCPYKAGDDAARAFRERAKEKETK